MFLLSSFTLLFSLIVFLMMATLIYRKVEKADSDTLLRVFLIPLIIIFAVYLVVVGYSENQLSPVMGLLGTIAGYLLGQQRSEVETKKLEKETEES